MDIRFSKLNHDYVEYVGVYRVEGGRCFTTYDLFCTIERTRPERALVDLYV